MNDKSITFEHSIRHLHLIRAAVGKLHGNYFWFGIKADRLKLDPLSDNKSFAQIPEREREPKPGKGPARLYLDLLGPVFISSFSRFCAVAVCDPKSVLNSR